MGRKKSDSDDSCEFYEFESIFTATVDDNSNYWSDSTCLGWAEAVNYTPFLSPISAYTIEDAFYYCYYVNSEGIRSPYPASKFEIATYRRATRFKISTMTPLPLASYNTSSGEFALPRNAGLSGINTECVGMYPG